MSGTLPPETEVDGFVVGMHNLYNFANMVALTSKCSMHWVAKQVSPNAPQ